MDKITFGILTISDSCSQGVAVDSSGPNLEMLIKTSSFSDRMVVETRKCVPDDRDVIKETLMFWSDEWDLDVIITTGGTGFGPRDVTAEATRQVIDRETPGITQAMLIESLKITPFAMLYRGICGIRKETLIINTPGSKKASGEFLQIVLKCIPHAVAVIKNITESVKETHKTLQREEGHNAHVHSHCSHGHTSKVDVTKVARRLRHQSVYPMISVEKAVELVGANTLPLETQTVSLLDEEARWKAVGCVLAEDVFAKEPYPPFRASIKDGYAVLASDGDGRREVGGDRIAGSLPNGQVKNLNGKLCVRISTGAPVPDEMDAVVQVEDTELIEEAEDGRKEVAVKILVKPEVGQDIRPIGSDIALGQLVVAKGKVISSTELGLFATVGATEISVYKRPTIGVLSTGDELVDPWSKTEPKPGCIRDSNKVTLIHLLKEQGFDAVDCGITIDNPDDVVVTMRQAFSKVDVLITTGSVSMGERDLIKKVLPTDFGATIHFGRVNMKPGKPMTFATMNGEDGRKKLVFALPGNPSSAVVTSHVFVLPALRQCSGHLNFQPERIFVQINTRINLDTRTEFKRAVLTLKSTPNGVKISAEITGNQISSRLSSLRDANGLLFIPEITPEKRCLEEGSNVSAILIGKLLIE